METCKYGLGASTRKPPTARWVWRWVLSPHNEEQDVKKKIMAYCMAGFVLALIILSVTVTSGVGLILFKQRKGLHSKRQERGVFIYAYSKKM